jgi:hypothetical protein
VSKSRTWSLCRVGTVLRREPGLKWVLRDRGTGQTHLLALNMMNPCCFSFCFSLPSPKR